MPTVAALVEQYRAEKMPTRYRALEVTQRYAILMTEDLQAVHERVSLLSSR